ncbi:MAG: hypothetical protein E7172_01320 [Firmicutes bacterium]|nr:hypothetical protein [Bacillota bacterium]
MNNFYKISIKGRNVSHIFNRILSEKINIFDVSYKKDVIILNASYEDFIKIKNLNTIYKIEIIDIYGIKKYKSISSFYKNFIIIFFIFLIFIFVYSKTIFKITIDCQNEELKNTINDELKKNNLTIFSFQKNFETLTKIKEKIKNNNKDLVEWIEIEKDGVYYNISIIERKKENDGTNLIKHNIVASKTGIIKDMYITSGEIKKNKGDYVSNGEVIVGANITKNEETKSIVDAKGKVFAEVWYRVKLNSNLKTKEKIITGRTTSIKVKILDKEITLLKYKNNNINQEKIKNLFTNSILKIYIEKQYIYKYVSKKYSESELLKILETKANEEITKSLSENEQILLQKTLKNSVSNGKMYVEVFFKVYEDIAEEKEYVKEEKEQEEN